MKTKNSQSNHNMSCSFLFIFLLLSIPIMLTAAEKPDFSGNWALNTEKSNLGERGRADKSKAIKQDGNNLIIERTSVNRDGEERKSTEKYTLDGKECQNEGFRNSIRKSTLSWTEDGKTLIIKSVMNIERDGEASTMETTEKMTLSADGKILTIESISARGSQTMVYDKK